MQIKVENSLIKPVIVKFDGIPSIFMRREGFNDEATYEEIINMSIHSQSASFDTVLSDKTYDPDDYQTLREFHRQHTEGKTLTDKALALIGFSMKKGFLQMDLFCLAIIMQNTKRMFNTLSSPDLQREAKGLFQLIASVGISQK